MIDSTARLGLPAPSRWLALGILLLVACEKEKFGEPDFVAECSDALVSRESEALGCEPAEVCGSLSSAPPAGDLAFYFDLKRVQDQLLDGVTEALPEQDQRRRQACVSRFLSLHGVLEVSTASARAESLKGVDAKGTYEQVMPLAGELGIVRGVDISCPREPGGACEACLARSVSDCPSDPLCRVEGNGATARCLRFDEGRNL